MGGKQKAIFFIALFLSSNLFSDIFQISYDVYFNGFFLGDTLAEVTETGELLALDSSIVLEKLPELLEELSVHDHPLQQKKFNPALLPMDLWLKTYSLIVRANSSEFYVSLSLPPNFHPIVNISIQPQEELREATLKPAAIHGWTLLSGRLGLLDHLPKFNGTWRSGFGFSDWHLFANGSYGEEKSKFLEKIRLERVIWTKRKSRFQLGFLEPPLIINGQLIDSETLGLSFSNVFNRFLQTGLIEELPGGILELLERSTVDIYNNNLLVKRLVLKEGRYRLKDLFLADGIHFVDVRITSESGRVIQRRLKVETFAHHPPAGDFEYVLYGGFQPNKDNAMSIGAALYHGFKGGLAAGFHGTYLENDGYRLGLYLDQYLGQTEFNLQAWHQNRVDNPQINALELNANLGFLPWSVSSRIIWNHYNENASPLDRQLEINFGFSPTILNANLLDIDFGLVWQVNKKNGFFIRLSRSWLINESVSISVSANLDTLSKNFQTTLSFSFSPSDFFNSSYTQTFGRLSSAQININPSLPAHDVYASINYAGGDKNTQDDLRASVEWRPSFANIRAQMNLSEEPSKYDFYRSEQYLAYETTLLLADGLFALSSETNTSFAVVDASKIQHANKLKVRHNGKDIDGLGGHFGIGNLQPFKSNRIDIDPTEVTMSMGYIDEFAMPTPGQGYAYLLEPKLAFMAFGKLFFPDGKPLNNAYGELKSRSSENNAEWFTGSEGDLVLEAAPGIWQGNVYWDKHPYTLTVEIKASSGEDGIISLGDIYLQERQIE